MNRFKHSAFFMFLEFFKFSNSFEQAIFDSKCVRATQRFLQLQPKPNKALKAFREACDLRIASFQIESFWKDSGFKMFENLLLSIEDYSHNSLVESSSILDSSRNSIRESAVFQALI